MIRGINTRNKKLNLLLNPIYPQKSIDNKINVREIQRYHSYPTQFNDLTNTPLNSH